MRILTNVTKQELEYYVRRPTSKAIHERTMKDSIFIPKDDKSAAAAYVANHNTVKTNNTEDKVEISSLGKELNQSENEKSTSKAEDNDYNIAFNIISRGKKNSISISFENSAMLNRAVKQGYIEVDGRQVELSDDVKKQLLVTNEQIQNSKKSIFMHNMLLHEAANARQSSDAMREANDKMSRAMTTASRIMHGRKVSPADEKELMEFNKDLYAMAKSAAALAEHQRKREDREDEKISAENDEARAREREPKDYSVEEIPMPTTEVQMDISFDSESPQVTAVGVGVLSS